MFKLVETKLQKFILLAGGILVFFRLSSVNYYQTYTAILQSIGIAVLTIVLLIILKDYKPEFHHKIWFFIKRYRKIFIILCLVILILLVASFMGDKYQRSLINKQIMIEEENFHNSEVAYQRCLDKVASLNHFGYLKPVIFPGELPKPVEVVSSNKYFNEWISAGRPYYWNLAGHWEWAFVKWMMENHSDYCREFNTNIINDFLKNK